MAYARKKKFWAPGHGNLHLSLESYTLCKDGIWHLLDTYNQKQPPFVMPLQVSHDTLFLRLSSNGCPNEMQVPPHKEVVRNDDERGTGVSYAISLENSRANRMRVSVLGLRHWLRMCRTCRAAAQLMRASCRGATACAWQAQSCQACPLSRAPW